MISLVITVFNEEKTIVPLLQSIRLQTKKPDEVIIVDGFSKDRTVEKIKEFKKRFDKKGTIRLIKKRSNRPVGRNLGIERARGRIIAITDAGCILHKNWLREIIRPFEDGAVDVVSGYYRSQDASPFERSVAAYTLVMPDRINPKNFLPSARSMAMRKSVWKRSGGFPKDFPLNEDYVFAHKLKKLGFKFSFTRKAIVYWKPRENIFKAFLMFYFFALGDSLAGIFRPKVILIFFRYVLVIWLLIISSSLSFYFMLQVISYILMVYIAWAVWKNYKYVKHSSAFLFLPLLQLTSDSAAILGTSVGFFRNLWDTRHKL